MKNLHSNQKGNCLPLFLSIFAILISLSSAIAVWVNFVKDCQSEKKAEELLLSQLLDEVFDLIGGIEGTLHIQTNLAKPHEFNRLEKARRKIENEILSRRPNHKRGMELMGIYLAKTGKLDEALVQFKKVINLYPDYHMVYINRGAVLASKDKLNKAIENYEKAIKLEPKSFRAYNNRGIIWKIKGEFDKAIEDFNKAIDFNPQFSIAYSNRGNTWFVKNEFGKAINDYNIASYLNPSLLVVYYNRSMAYYKVKDYKNSLDSLEKLFSVDQNSARACNWKARILSTCPDKKFRDGFKAIGLAKRALEISEKFGFMDTLAAAYAEFGDYVMAAKIQEKAISILQNEGKKEIIKTYISHLKLYLKEQPLRE